MKGIDTGTGKALDCNGEGRWNSLVCNLQILATIRYTD